MFGFEAIPEGEGVMGNWVEYGTAIKGTKPEEVIEGHIQPTLEPPKVVFQS